ncbi:MULTISPECIES: pyridoxamine 5'-phosphate oxidase family protein [unclassified Tenacibaculum]|uniref:pyridoxamine 5'-phosphate oxidase family protein n=1 Tax=unclassified Tenacibaculum TaxID=2635139 RepID=UPI001F198B4A|nr:MULTISPECIES: pyridoxamine 5'-phosphate oxidase family protein [unclassified Tenacibaculum]MCF2874745.1 pyridoxamine 5'-phosphate oxidase family protein [Tenacibaculum sp. Cn5-1]MCF2934189.1 pyridoxamine 5'-phosphate oxidase family protein [Tenacibaculum sp. Cn5-34]MCG7510399.1 pyridoxamine 5'-phosphate oxidase family protein [Tenacibaculum sp. Cn5-46]
MAKFYDKINSRVQKFIEAQKVFFVATAPKGGRINLSPKGMDSFRVLNENRVAWLSVTGSGNETSAHLLEDNRITIMFCAFEGAPNILRLYGKAKEVLPDDTEWNSLISLFTKLSGTRQIFDVTIESVQTSCGMSIPFYEYKEERNQLLDWADEKGKNGIEQYWKDRNQVSIDGLNTKFKE